MRHANRLLLIVWLATAPATFIAQQPTQAGGAPVPDPPEIAARKAAVATRVDGMAKQAQEMVDSVFSFGELGFQEVETSRYLTGILEKNGFTVERGVAGIPTAWVGDLGQRQAGDRARLRHRRHPAGVAEARRRLPRPARSPARRATARATTAGMPLNIAAALAVKQIMERDKLPGHADALAGRGRGAARARRRGSCATGMFKDVDICLFTHVGNNFGVSWGAGRRQRAWSRSSTRSRARARTAPARRGAAAARSTPSS